MLTLEELGATGNLGLTATLANPVIMAGVGGLATSATAQATVEVSTEQSLAASLQTICPCHCHAPPLACSASALMPSCAVASDSKPACCLSMPLQCPPPGLLSRNADASVCLQRMLLWQLRNETIAPFNETAQQVYARLSALVDSLDGPLFLSQGLVNTDPRTIAVPDTGACFAVRNCSGKMTKILGKCTKCSKVAQNSQKIDRKLRAHHSLSCDLSVQASTWFPQIFTA